MTRFLRILLLSATLFVAACDDNGNQSNEAMVSMSAPSGGSGGMARSAKAYMGGAAPMMAQMAVMPSPEPAMADSAAISPSAPPSSMVLDRTKFANRKIAETHNMQIETAYNVLQTRYQRDYAKCVQLGCQIVNSNVQLEQGGSINARIEPEKLGEFLDFLAAGPGRILNHNVSADDRTAEWSDTTAQMENLVAARDRMRKLMDSDKAYDVDSILSIENELTRIQTEIDMRTARLRNLAQDTDLATIYLNYSVEYRPAETKPYELKNTFKNAVQQFYRGLDRMIQFVGRTLPWIPVFAIGFWLAVWVVRLAFRRVSVRLPWKKKP